MSKHTPRRDNGPAFPVPELSCWDGRTLRDWFAGQALANLGDWAPEFNDRKAEWAYAQADAMLDAREGPQDPTPLERELVEAGKDQTEIIHRAQRILTGYLVPDGLTAEQALSALLGLMDGPAQRNAQKTWDAAIAKAKGEDQ